MSQLNVPNRTLARRNITDFLRLRFFNPFRRTVLANRGQGGINTAYCVVQRVTDTVKMENIA